MLSMNLMAFIVNCANLCDMIMPFFLLITLRNEGYNYDQK